MHHVVGWWIIGVGMASEGRDRSNRWLQSLVWPIGSVAILGLVIAGVFVIRSLTASNGGTAPGAPAEERAVVEGDESLVDGTDGTSAGDKPAEESGDLLAPPEEPTESSISASPEPEVTGEQPAADVDTGDDEVQRPPEPEVVNEQPDQVTTTTEPSDAVLVDDNDVIEFAVSVGSPESTGWIVPWGDEVLEIGWLKIGEKPNGNSIYDETYLVARVLSDSDDCQNIRPISKASDYPKCWGDLNHYLIRDASGRISAIISDGHRLIVAFEDSGQVYISVTNDLINWDTTEFEPPPPAGLPDFVYASSYVGFLALNSNGWLVKITTELSIDVLFLAGVREPDIGIRSVYELNRRLTIQGADVGPEGLLARWWLDDERTHYREQYFPWSSLGISRRQFCDYSHYCNNKGAVHSSNISGSVWAATWGNDPIRVELPMGLGVSGKCCAIVGTDSGYVAFSDPGESGYDPTWFGPTEVFYSSDGVEWNPVDSPSEVFLDIWAVNNGVVASSVPVRGDDELPWSNWDTIHWWLANSDGSNWREIGETSIGETSELELTFFHTPFSHTPAIWLATGLAVGSTLE